jgi:hypothetical protein
MTYEEPSWLPDAEWTTALESGVPDRICRALTIAALHHPDRAFVEFLIVRWIRHSDPWVRGVAALCAGHTARRHRQLSREFVPLIEGLLTDPQTSGNAQDALDDIRQFVADGPLA